MKGEMYRMVVGTFTKVNGIVLEQGRGDGFEDGRKR
jgi:hypothetical protein